MNLIHKITILALFLLSGIFLNQATAAIALQRLNGQGCPVDNNNGRDCTGGNGTCALQCEQKALGCNCI